MTEAEFMKLPPEQQQQLAGASEAPKAPKMTEEQFMKLSPEQQKQLAGTSTRTTREQFDAMPPLQRFAQQLMHGAPGRTEAQDPAMQMVNPAVATVVGTPVFQAAAPALDAVSTGGLLGSELTGTAASPWSGSVITRAIQAAKSGTPHLAKEAAKEAAKGLVTGYSIKKFMEK